MTDTTKSKGSSVEQLLDQLPPEIRPGSDLWPSIEQSLRDHLPHEGQFSSLPQEIEPEKDLWPAIASRLNRDRRKGLFSRIDRSVVVPLLAAGLALLAIGGFLVFEPELMGGPTSEPSLIANQPDDPTSTPGAEVLPSALVFAPTTDASKAEAQDTYREHIALVRNQRATIEESMDRYPADPRLRALWRHAYETELRLIDAAGRVLTTI